MSTSLQPFEFKLIVEEIVVESTLISETGTIVVQDNSLRIVPVGPLAERGIQGDRGLRGFDGVDGPPIVNAHSYAFPGSETSLALDFTEQRERLFIKSSGGAVVNPVISNGSGTQELYLFGSSDADTILLENASNLLLSGSIVLRNGTQLVLHWIAGLNKWVEANRNEI